MKKSNDRFHAYQRILEKRPEYLTAIRRTEEALEPELDTRLYLYTMAPVLTEYVNWVLDEAVQSGKKRLYFLSRDGYQMYLAACRLAELRGIEVECRYLHVSRYSMRVPSYHLELENCLDLICVGGIDVTLEKILRRAALSTEEVVEVIYSIGWQDKYNEILNYRQVLELKQELKCEKKLLYYIEKHSREAYESAMGYLTQEGLLSEVPYALVDSGWVGTLQQSVERLVHSGKEDIWVEGYYFGLYELPKDADVTTYHAWYFTPDKGLARKAHFSNSLFEAICSAEEGMTKGYARERGRYVPVLRSSGNPNGEQIRRNVKGLEAFLIYCGEAEGPERRTSSSRKLIQGLFNRFMANPTELEVEAYGNNLFSDDVTDGNWKQVAAGLTEEQIKTQRLFYKLWILAGRKRTEIRESAWIEGSIVRCGGRRIKSNLWHARLYKYFVYARKQTKAVKRLGWSGKEAELSCKKAEEKQYGKGIRSE